MPKNVDKPSKLAQQHLSQAIYKLKQGADLTEVLPTLELVLTHLENMARHDPLTGALNRRTLTEMLNAELARSYRTGHTFSVVMLSIDRFQDTMDTYGRPVAVAVLRQVTEVAQNMLRTLDSFGRVTGDEFAIVMPTTWVDQSMKAITRLRNQLDEVEWATLAPGLQFSFCTGITHNAPGDTADAMLSRARTALAQARQKGPGSVVQVEPDIPEYDPTKQ